MSENYQTPGDVLSFLTASAVVKNLAAKLVAGRKVDEGSTAGARAVGVIQDTETATGKDIAVIKGPSFKYITSGAAFSDLDALAMDTAGKFRTATAAQVVLAFAMEAAGGADEKRLAFLLPMSQYRIPSTGLADLAAITGGEAPTEAEHNLIVSKVNAVIAILEAQEIATVV
jgi:hypothetical protein